jgi:hypothetical protein
MGNCQTYLKLKEEIKLITYQQFPFWILQPAVAVDSSAECHASLANLRIRRLINLNS